jgi:hypothetical protein
MLLSMTIPVQYILADDLLFVFVLRLVLDVYHVVGVDVGNLVHAHARMLDRPLL